MRWNICLSFLILCVLFCSGCATYQKCIRPTPKLGELCPELSNLSDEKIELYLRSNVKPSFPAVLAIAKIEPTWGYRDKGGYTFSTIKGEEAAGWKQLTSNKFNSPRELISQVHFISPIFTDDRLTLKALRDAAALVHAPILLVYLQTENSSSGYNGAAMAYWSFVGLFCVPGNTVGHYSVCQSALIDTQTGFILVLRQH